MRKNIIFQIYLSVLMLAFTARSTYGAVIHVTTTEDKVPGSLRAAVTTANTNNEKDTVYLPAGIYRLTGNYKEDDNGTGDLDINSPDRITIVGDKAETTIIDGNQVDRVLHIHFHTVVSIYHITIRNGKTNDQGPRGGADHGGGILNRGTLTLSGCIVTDNATGDGPPAAGGGIHNRTRLTLIDCTIKNNRTGDNSTYGHGGGIYNSPSGNAELTNCTINNNRTGYDSHANEDGSGSSGGGICNQGKMTLTNCTVSENEAGTGSGEEGRGGDGGGICNINGELTITNCTISDNIAGQSSDYTIGGYGGGICNFYEWASVSIKNTIVANNHVRYLGKGPDCYGTLNSLGYNLIENTNQCTVSGTLTGNITGKDPMLNPLADNGGSTFTCELMEGSPAIDAGNSTGTYTDQRGYHRPVDTPGYTNSSDCSDIGAFELQAEYSISGRISAAKGGAAGATLTFSSGEETTADENGNYYLPVPFNWTGTVTPSKEDYMFTPVSIDYTNVKSPITHQNYIAVPFSVSVIITTPQDGETVSGTVTISASASSSKACSSIQSVTRVEFYIDGVLVETDTVEPFQYSWDTTLYTNGNHTIKVRATNTANQEQENEITVTVENLWPMSLSRARLNFGADTSEIKTSPQYFIISGGTALNWTVDSNTDWLDCNPTSGTGPGKITVSIDTSQHAPGAYNGTISVESPDADNSPQTLTVYLEIYSTGTTSAPFGSFDTPVDGTTVSGSVPVTGWVLDDIEAEDIKIYRAPLAGAESGIVYIGDAVLVEGARPDIEIAFPAYPFHYQAGWGYMMLTNFLPDQGNGTFTLHAVVTDKEGNRATLGTTTITCDNANAVKPFGAIDTPTQGGSVSGGSLVNFGWALTPLPNAIPADGSTIDVLVDGVSLGHPVYDLYREDIATLFPGYNNSDGAVGYFDLDSTEYENGVHTIYWIVEDDAGNADGIGSRYFTIQNSTQNRSRPSAVFSRPSSLVPRPSDEFPVDYINPIGVGKGYRKNLEIREMYPDENGIVKVNIRELERVVLHLTPNASHQPLTPLPIGSTFDPGLGIFYWSPGPGFLGLYEFVFIENQTAKRIIHINITPK